MDRSNVITLVNTSYAVDLLGQRVPVEVTRKVYAKVQSATRAEWNAAGQNGIAAAFVVSMFKWDYKDESVVVFNGTRYAVYRTYERGADIVELYLQREAGVTNGER